MKTLAKKFLQKFGIEVRRTEPNKDRSVVNIELGSLEFDQKKLGELKTKEQKKEAERSLPFSIVVPTIYGSMILNRYDINQTNSLVKTGKGLGDPEVEFLKQSLIFIEKQNKIILDVGANFGVFTLGLLAAVGPSGKVYSFEPQRIIFNMLAGSVALNAFCNVYLFNMAVGDRLGKIEIPQFDYSMPLNFGSIEFGNEQKEPLSQSRGENVDLIEHISLTTIDHMAFADVDLIKIDVEGMEANVLIGARETIDRCRPLLYVEHQKSDKASLREQIERLRYVVYERGYDFFCIPEELHLKMQGFLDIQQQCQLDT